MKIIIDEVFTMEVDVQDFYFAALNDWKYQKKESDRTAYAYNNQLGYFHRCILKVTNPDLQVDHLDGNGLNNKRDNLRIVVNRVNAQNNYLRRAGLTLSKYYGITKSHDSWRVRVYIKGKHISLGSYISEEEAARVYDAYMIKHFSPELRGVLNFPVRDTFEG